MEAGQTILERTRIIKGIMGKEELFSSVSTHSLTETTKQQMRSRSWYNEMECGSREDIFLLYICI